LTKITASAALSSDGEAAGRARRGVFGDPPRRVRGVFSGRIDFRKSTPDDRRRSVEGDTES
jgi:hypothetical protein